MSFGRRPVNTMNTKILKCYLVVTKTHQLLSIGKTDDENLRLASSSVQ